MITLPYLFIFMYYVNAMLKIDFISWLFIYFFVMWLIFNVVSGGKRVRHA